MSNTYIVIATEDELKLVKEILACSHSPIIMTGVGATNVIKALRDIPRDSWIINVGFAGSVDIAIGTMVKVGKARLLHEVPYDEEVFRLCDGGVTCYTSNDFVKSSCITGCVFDMELAIICAMGFKLVSSYKKISDHCSYEEYINNKTR